MRAAEISTVIGARDRERLTKFARTVGEKARARRLGTPLRHELEAFDGLERANQNRVRVAFFRHDDVEGPARSIKEVHVGVSGWTEHGFGAFGAAFRAVRREIGGTAVRFDFDDPSRGHAVRCSMYENFSDAIARDGENGARVERPREFTWRRHLCFSTPSCIGHFEHSCPSVSSSRPMDGPAVEDDIRRLENFERTGQAVPAAEVKAWIDSWGTANELPRPQLRKVI